MYLRHSLNGELDVSRRGGSVQSPFHNTVPTQRRPAPEVLATEPPAPSLGPCWGVHRLGDPQAGLSPGHVVSTTWATPDLTSCLIDLLISPGPRQVRMWPGRVSRRLRSPARNRPSASRSGLSPLPQAPPHARPPGPANPRS